jgi:hypothetical protein
MIESSILSERTASDIFYKKIEVTNSCIGLVTSFSFISLFFDK